MSTKVVWRVANVLRDAGIMHRHVGVFLLQVLAWDKLDRVGDLPPAFSLQAAEQGLEVKEAIRRSFEYLSRDGRLGEDGRAFEADPQVFRSLSEAEFRSLLSVVTAAKGEQLDYHEAIEAAMRSYGLDDPYNIIPDEVAGLIVKLSRVRAAESVYCPFEGAYRLAERANRVTRDVFLEPRIISPLSSLMNVLLDGSIKVRFGDPIRDPGWTEWERLRLFDVSLAAPPFNQRYDQYVREDLFDDKYGRFPEKTYYGEVLHIRHVLSQTARRAIVVVPNSILFRTAAGEREFKADLLGSGMLEAVIGLPAALLTTTSIPFSIVALNKERRFDSVLFIEAGSEHFFEAKKGRGSLDAGRRTLKNADEIMSLFEQRVDGKFSKVVSRAECEANDYNLAPARYVAPGVQLRLEELSPGSVLVQLGDLAEIMRPQYLKDEAEEGNVEIAEVSVSDIGDDGYVRHPKKVITPSEKALAKVRNQFLQPGDILLAVKGSVGRVGLVPRDVPGKWLANQSFQILRLRHNQHITDPVVLFRYLSSPAAQALIQARTGGSGVKMIQTRDVKALPVIVPPAQEQAAVTEEHEKIVTLYAEAARLRAEAGELEMKRWAV